MMSQEGEADGSRWKYIEGPKVVAQAVHVVGVTHLGSQRVHLPVKPDCRVQEPV